jgi:drug/metabolite transporter (DMT)-like permease
LKKYAAIFVALGAISYGIPGSLFKMARAQGVHDGMLLCLTFLIAWFFFVVASAFLKPAKQNVPDKREKWLVILSGSSMGFTNTFYLLSLSYVPVAVAAVMMMQSVWLAIIISSVLHRRWPSLLQVFSIGIVLVGTVLATGLFPIHQAVSLIGLSFSFLAALAYALTIQFTGGIGQDLHPLTKARLMSFGALLLIIMIWGHTLFEPQSLIISLKWGGITSVFAMIFPLTSFSYFMPHLAIGIGPIISSLELPSSVIFALFLLAETVSDTQVIGVGLIIIAVIITNLIPVLMYRRKYQTHN